MGIAHEGNWADVERGDADTETHEDSVDERVARHAGCTACRNHTRASAYRWLGEPHWIPGIHGANWLGDDIRLTANALALGETIVLDYRGQVEGAPQVTLRRSAGDVIVAQAPDGGADSSGADHWSWEPTPDPVERLDWIAYTLVGYLKELRGARGVILIEPQTREGGEHSG